MVWTNIPDTDIDQDSPVTVSLMTALRDNVEAGIQFDTNAPVNTAAWHPADLSVVGGGQTGLFYTGAALNDIQTQLIGDGFDYRIEFRSVTLSTGTWDTVNVAVQSTGASIFFGDIALRDAADSGPLTGVIDLLQVRQANVTHVFDARVAALGGSTNSKLLAFQAAGAPLFNIQRVRFQSVGPSQVFNGGSMALFRRRRLA